ncbi:TIGR02587 family membrane protein [Paracoccus alcaliphilus]|nr:TIGR02587 family membrane protein [Paracoccus alcaliphilus]WCR18703.1 TIGR02587 family membrane protein [Paracoccus alcaliphilus]
MAQSGRTASHPPNRVFRDFGRAAGGALIFSLPMLMTMELWSLGFYLDRLRLLLLVVVTLPLLVLLSRHIGFERTRGWRSDVFDSLIALGVAAVISAVVLFLLGVIDAETSLDAVLGKISIQMIPASIGALLAKSQLGAGSGDDPEEQDESWWGELFLMAVGALFLGLNTAPTEEVMVISYQMTHWHALALVVLSLLLMHGFVFSVGFAGGSEVSSEERWWSAFIRMTLPGFIIALTVSFCLLWLFARTDGLSFDSALMATIVLAFPCAIGAAAARLIL